MTTDIDQRLRAYATAEGLSVSAARQRLIQIALDHLDARRRAGEARHRGTTADQRRASAQRAVAARWAKTKTPPPD
jgi:hypothetical protein